MKDLIRAIWEADAWDLAFGTFFVALIVLLALGVIT